LHHIVVLVHCTIGHTIENCKHISFHSTTSSGGKVFGVSARRGRPVARYGLMQVCPISAGLVARDDRLAAQWPGGERAEAVLSGNEAIGR
jgi:hypothetical protein